MSELPASGTLKILMTADAVGGVFSYVLELGRRLCAAGHALLVATMGPRPSRAQVSELRSVSGLDVRVSDYALEWMAEPWGDVDSAGAWLLELERSFTPDLVHLNGYSHGALPWRAPCVVVAHSCVSSWWQAVHGRTPPAQYTPYHRRVQQGLAGAAAVVAPTRAMLGALREHYGPLRSPSVIANGVESGRFTPAAKEPFYLAAGRFADPAKNLAAICRAAPELPWPVRVCGVSGGSAEQAAPPNVSWLGVLSRSELAHELARASVFLHPARYEPFGLAPLEAALSGCALILGDIPSLRETWRDAAIYVPPDDVEALVERASRLAIDSVTRERLAVRARERALTFSSSRFARAYVELYRELIPLSEGPLR
jgi:glycosyltransferase involved in cell wall biosynthesis